MTRHYSLHFRVVIFYVIYTDYGLLKTSFLKTENISLVWALERHIAGGKFKPLRSVWIYFDVFNVSKYIYMYLDYYFCVMHPLMQN